MKAYLGQVEILPGSPEERIVAARIWQNLVRCWRADKKRAHSGREGIEIDTEEATA